MLIKMKLRVSPDIFLSGLPVSSKNISIRSGQGYSIGEDEDGGCLFYKDGCTIHPVRPSQCITFPFWFENLRSSKKWRKMARECPGIGCGSLYSKEQILEIVQSNMEAVVKSHLFQD